MKKRKSATHADDAASPLAKRRNPRGPINGTKGTTEPESVHQQSGSALKRDQSCELEMFVEMVRSLER